MQQMFTSIADEIDDSEDVDVDDELDDIIQCAALDDDDSDEDGACE